MGFLIRKRILLAVLLCMLYGVLAYFTVRSEFVMFIVLSGFAFLITFIIIEKSAFSFKQLLILSILYRLIFLLATPQLSQDFFRFFWDGQLLLNNVNPYLQTVEHYFTAENSFHIYQSETLKLGMGELNASNYSNYPPFSQFLYAIAAWFAQDSIQVFIVVLRLLLIGFDLLFIYAARKLLIHFKANPKRLFWYSLNPLCILEITGNLHLEGVMISLFVVGFYLLLKQKHLQSAALISLSVGTKLLSVLSIPLILRYLFQKNTSPKNYKSMFSFGVWFLVVLSLQFIYFFNSEFISNFSTTIGLWFGKFEFNASIFYLLRWVGFQTYGYNIIQSYGFWMPVVSILFFMILIFQSKTTPLKVMLNFLWMLTVYFLLSTTVHPWYILFPLALSVFTKYNYVILWSFLALLSYSAYRNEQFNESSSILFLEYGGLLVFILFELTRPKTNLFRRFFEKNIPQVSPKNQERIN
jgi:hypothetical protein